MARTTSSNSISNNTSCSWHENTQLLSRAWIVLACVAFCGWTDWARGQDAAVAPAPGAAVIASDYVWLQTGELPIIISAPHGGNKSIAGVSPRSGEGLETGPSGFFTGRDTATEELAREVADAIKLRFGKAPYLVASRLHRKFLDPNRPVEIAFDNPTIKPIYDLYHGSLSEYCRDVTNKFHVGVLIDIHGQGSRANTVFRGTKNGLTVTRLREQFGDKAHNGPGSLFGMLETRGWIVYPTMLADPSAPVDKEQGGFTGGYIVQSYGSHKASPIDAMQLEFGAEYRTKSRRPETAKILADALAEYASAYLKIEVPLAPKVTVDQPFTASVNAKAGLRVAVFVDSGVSSTNKLFDVLKTDNSLAVEKVNAADIIQGELDNYSVLIHPGGSGSGQGKALGEAGRAKVRSFIQSGKGMVGICAGAYLASCDYDWSLHVLDAKVIDRAHWNRGFGTVAVSLSAQGQELLEIKPEKVDLYYHQGPLLAPAADPDVPDFTPLAKFEGEIAKNGAPKGVMPGTTAIATGQFGKGRVVCFSPHPEKTAGMEPMVLRGIHWAAGEVSTAKP